METTHQLPWAVCIMLLVISVLPTGGGDINGKTGRSRDSVFYEWWLRRLNTTPQDLPTTAPGPELSSEGSPVVTAQTTPGMDVPAKRTHGFHPLPTASNTTTRIPAKIPTSAPADTDNKPSERGDGLKFPNKTKENEAITQPPPTGDTRHINDYIPPGVNGGNFTLNTGNDSNSVEMENLPICGNFSEDIGNINQSFVDTERFGSEELTNGTGTNNLSLTNGTGTNNLSLTNGTGTNNLPQSLNVSDSLIQQNISRNVSQETIKYKCFTKVRSNSTVAVMGNISRETDYLSPEVESTEAEIRSTENVSTSDSTKEKELKTPHQQTVANSTTGQMVKNTKSSLAPPRDETTEGNPTSSEADVSSLSYHYQTFNTKGRENQKVYSKLKSDFGTSSSALPLSTVHALTQQTSTKPKEVPQEGTPPDQSEEVSPEERPTPSVQSKPTSFGPSGQPGLLPGEQTSHADQSDSSDTTPTTSTGYMYPTTEFDPFSNRGGPFLRKPNAYDFLMMGQIATVKKTEAQREFTESNLEASAMICAMFNKDFCRLSIGGRCC